MYKSNKLWLVLLALALLLLAVWQLPVKHWLELAIAWIELHPGWSWLAYIALYIVVSVLLVPASLLTLAAGALFGLLQGVIVVSLASVAAAVVAFLIGRGFAREHALKLVQKMPKFLALDRAIAEKGFLVVLLTRLSPVFPFGLQNYAYSVTAVKLRDYTLASWIGMIPGTIMYVYFGSLARSLAAIFNGEVEVGSAGRLFFIIGLIATVVVTVLVTRMATRILKQDLLHEPEPN
ncbi:MAG: TVP38/TMEM64 family protein [Gammaproteobacteria bacterium]|jgi:uncharacterized membrane protein YdjX (TVP38/TMEM64 family)|nr:TVP38/TMEM64 family protein [Gammaproteobacteria bacterium]